MTMPIPPVPDHSEQGFRMDSMAPGPMGRSYMQPGEHLNQIQFGGSAGLANAQQRINSAVPQAVKQTGSSNGISNRQAAFTMGGMLKPVNGMSADQYGRTQGGQLPNQEATSTASFGNKKWFGEF